MNTTTNTNKPETNTTKLRLKTALRAGKSRVVFKPGKELTDTVN